MSKILDNDYYPENEESMKEKDYLDVSVKVAIEILEQLISGAKGNDLACNMMVVMLKEIYARTMNLVPSGDFDKEMLGKEFVPMFMRAMSNGCFQQANDMDNALSWL